MGGPDSAQAVGPHTMLQGMTRIARWLARGSDSEGVVERAIRRSLIGKWKMVWLELDVKHAVVDIIVCPELASLGF